MLVPDTEYRSNLWILCTKCLKHFWHKSHLIGIIKLDLSKNEPIIKIFLWLHMYLRQKFANTLHLFNFICILSDQNVSKQMKTNLRANET